jgi:hypothetical protein
MLWNHLWQSTLFAAAVALVTLAFRRNRAQVRYWLWLAASVKFLIPFSALLWLGAQIELIPLERRKHSQDLFSSTSNRRSSASRASPGRISNGAWSRS